MAMYCGRFIPSLALLSEPLRALMKNSVPWDWKAEANASFHAIKKALMDKTNMAYFHPG